MRNLSLLLFLFPLFIGCSKEEKTNPIQSVNYPLSAKINNREWIPSSYQAFLEEGRVIIQGNSEDKRFLLITLSSSDTGTYMADDFTQSNYATFIDSSLFPIVRKYTTLVKPVYNSRIQLSKFDSVQKTISGTFNLVLADENDQRLIAVEFGAFNNLPLQTTTTGSDSINCSFMRLSVGSAYTYFVGTNVDEVLINQSSTYSGADSLILGDSQLEGIHGYKCDGTYSYVIGDVLTRFETASQSIRALIPYAKEGMTVGSTWNLEISNFPGLKVICSVTDLLPSYSVIPPSSSSLPPKTYNNVYKVRIQLDSIYQGEPFEDDVDFFMFVSQSEGLIASEHRDFGVIDQEL